MRAKRIDANQPQIVKLFRDLGASVQVLSYVGKGCPDLLVGMLGYNFLVEVKDGSKCPSQRKLTQDEQAFFDAWEGHCCVISTIDQVIDLVNAVRLKGARK